MGLFPLSSEVSMLESSTTAIDFPFVILKVDRSLMKITRVEEEPEGKGFVKTLQSKFSQFKERVDVITMMVKAEASFCLPTYFDRSRCSNPRVPGSPPERRLPASQHADLTRYPQSPTFQA